MWPDDDLVIRKKLNGDANAWCTQLRQKRALAHLPKADIFENKAF
jgi:hypothetical protein